MDLVRIRYIKEWISQLPSGNITYKNIHGKRYPYYQWTENGKQRCRVVKADELQALSEKIEQRKVLQQKLRDAEENDTAPEVMGDEFFFSAVKKGKELTEFVKPVRSLKKRECYSKLHDYVYGNTTDRVLILYGLRRTGNSIFELSATPKLRIVVRDLSDSVLYSWICATKKHLLFSQ